MERLTKRLNNEKELCIDVCGEKCIEDHTWCPKCKPFTNVMKKLAEYEDLEEQGLLLRLPCKVGEVLWCIDNKKVEPFIVKEFKICAYKINRIEIYFENASGFGLCLFDGTLDEGWFLTKKEAEAALAKMKEDV